MVHEQLRPNGITDPRVLQAMGEVPREEFLPPHLRRHAYDDRALGIGNGQTISQPLVVGAMTQALDLTPEDRVLEVGAGSGYQAAVLSRLANRVVTVERDQALAEQAAANLRRLGFDNVDIVLADGRLGWPPGAPYDAILVAAAAPEVPPALIEQLADSGRLVIPLGHWSNDFQELRLMRKSGDELTSQVLFPVRFVPLL
jgi:protein-L-isoaspartate(D-aspartate) O-methyltransferase